MATLYLGDSLQIVPGFLDGLTLVTPLGNVDGASQLTYETPDGVRVRLDGTFSLSEGEEAGSFFGVTVTDNGTLLLSSPDLRHSYGSRNDAILNRPQIEVWKDYPDDGYGGLSYFFYGRDLFEGTDADERALGFDGHDILLGGGGADELIGQDGIDVLDGGAGNDRLSGGDRPDWLFGRLGDDWLDGGAGDDIIDAGDGEDVVFGGSGADVITAGAGISILKGGEGNDRLEGGAGDDRLYGGTARDWLTGGAGADDFIVRSLAEAGINRGRDIVMDFVSGEDDIDLRRIDADTGTSGDQGFTFIDGQDFSGTAGELRYFGAFLSGDVDGDGRKDFDIELFGNPAIFAGDLAL